MVRENTSGTQQVLTQPKSASASSLSRLGLTLEARSAWTVGCHGTAGGKGGVGTWAGRPHAELQLRAQEEESCGVGKKHWAWRTSSLTGGQMVVTPEASICCVPTVCQTLLQVGASHN